MKLTVWLPTEVLLDEEVTRISAEAQNGWFGLLPKHVDFVTALVPGVLTFEPCGKPERVPRGGSRSPGEVWTGSEDLRFTVRGTNLEATQNGG